MTAEPLPGPYSLAGTAPIIVNGEEKHPAQLMRENSGALVIMAPHPDEPGERLRLGTVDLTIDVKRGQGWKVEPDEDPQQMATARLWMAAPELLDVLIETRRLVSEAATSGFVDEAAVTALFVNNGAITRAIAKAEGTQ